LFQVCLGVLPELDFLAGLPPGLATAFNALVESPSPTTGVDDRSLSTEETLAKLFPLARGECTSGVADRDPAGLSFWTLLPALFFFLRSDALLP
jgi:hypothetical protein